MIKDFITWSNKTVLFSFVIGEAFRENHRQTSQNIEQVWNGVDITLKKKYFALDWSKSFTCTNLQWNEKSVGIRMARENEMK